MGEVGFFLRLEAEIKHRELKTPDNILALEGMTRGSGWGRRHR